MTSLLNRAAVDGLQFFGRISASISHELKNTLSIMNESAGLLEDLSLLAEKGKPLDLERVKHLSGLIKRQIQRTDQIIRNMNRFAHAVDDPFKEIGLHEFLTLVLAVSRRLTEARGVTVELAPVSENISVTTRPFYLHHLVWRILELGMEAVGESKRIGLEIKPTGQDVEILFSGLDNLPDRLAARSFPDESEQTLLALLEARLQIENENPQMRVMIPVRLDT